mgnify:CR=1 FL=1
MGSKNRINLGIIIDMILHFHRNFYIRTGIYMSKRVQHKIKTKHKDAALYTEFENFQELMQATVFSVGYNKCDETKNFIAYIDERFILYSLKREKHHTSCNTIYALNQKTLKQHYKQENFKILKKEYENIIEEYIAN